jgi:hypothetical protein
MQTISELEKEIRNKINTPWKQNALLQDSAVWEMLCSCLDTIGDTDLALHAYLELEWPEEDGARYIIASSHGLCVEGILPGRRFKRLPVADHHRVRGTLSTRRTRPS